MSIPKLPGYSLDHVTLHYNNKPGWRIDPKRAVLLIHDMQNYFIQFYGADNPMVHGLIHQINTLKQWCSKVGIPCIYTAQPANQNPEERALLTDFWGSGLTDQNRATNIVDSLTPSEQDSIFTKWRYSAFKKNNLQQWMQDQGRDQIIICGVYAHIGIVASALEAFMLDIQPFVIADAVADFSAEDHQQAMQFIAHRCGVVCTTHSVVNQFSSKKVANTDVRQDVAEILMVDVSELDESEDLQYSGLDSIRLMNLIELWQGRYACVLDFAEFAEEMTIKNWLNRLNQSMSTQASMSVEQAQLGLTP